MYLIEKRALSRSLELFYLIHDKRYIALLVFSMRSPSIEQERQGIIPVAYVISKTASIRIGALPVKPSARLTKTKLFGWINAVTS